MVAPASASSWVTALPIPPAPAPQISATLPLKSISITTLSRPTLLAGDRPACASSGGEASVEMQQDRDRVIRWFH
jgi:hypothetical protein